jgi:RNA polymerase sigma-B factor
MFELFIDRARRVVILAQEEARMLKHNYAGTEHLLLGWIREDEAEAASEGDDHARAVQRMFGLRLAGTSSARASEIRQPLGENMDAARDEPGFREPATGPSDRELAQAVQSLPRDDPRRDAALTELVARYQSLVRACVHRYRSGPESADDLMQVGYLGLLKAISRFDAEIGDSLAAYAQPTISGELKRHFRDKRWQVHVRRSAQELRLRIIAATADLTQPLARSPTDTDLAAFLDVTVEDVREAQLAGAAFQASSLDAPVTADPGGASFADLAGEDDPGLEHTLDMQAVWTHLPELPEREQRLLMMRFYGNMTQTQIAAKLGLSQMHVSRLLSHALGHLRNRINDPGPPAETAPVSP